MEWEVEVRMEAKAFRKVVTAAALEAVMGRTDLPLAVVAVADTDNKTAIKSNRAVKFSMNDAPMRCLKNSDQLFSSVSICNENVIDENWNGKEELAEEQGKELYTDILEQLAATFQEMIKNVNLIQTFY